MPANASRYDAAFNPHRFFSGTLFVVAKACAAAQAPALTKVSEKDAKIGVVDCTDARLKERNPGLSGDPDRLICFDGYVSNLIAKPRTDRGKRSSTASRTGSRTTSRARYRRRQAASARRAGSPSPTSTRKRSRRAIRASNSHRPSRKRTRTGTIADIWRGNIWSSAAARMPRCSRRQRSAAARPVRAEAAAGA